MSTAQPEQKTVSFIIILIALLAAVIVVVTLAFILWPDIGGGWLSSLAGLLGGIFKWTSV